MPPGKATPTMRGSRTQEILHSEPRLPDCARASGPMLPTHVTAGAVTRVAPPTGTGGLPLSWHLPFQ